MRCARACEWPVIVADLRHGAAGLRQHRHRRAAQVVEVERGDAGGSGRLGPRLVEAPLRPGRARGVTRIVVARRGAARQGRGKRAGRRHVGQPGVDVGPGAGEQPRPGSCPRAWCSGGWSTTMTGRAGLEAVGRRPAGAGRARPQAAIGDGRNGVTARGTTKRALSSRAREQALFARLSRSKSPLH
jgi:hypothetical protein